MTLDLVMGERGGKAETGRLLQEASVQDVRAQCKVRDQE